jgi:cytochrome c2
MARVRFILISCFFILWIPPVYAEDFRRGQNLYDDHCDVCHESFTHPGKDHHVKSLSDLRKRIAAWAAHTGLEWDEEDVNDVAYYLNTTYYHFK